MKNLRSPEKLETQPGVVNAEDGYVFLDGPDGIAITLTPEAATIMGESLIAAAKAAKKQMGAMQNVGYDRIY
jgi:hypothetical protein